MVGLFLGLGVPLQTFAILLIQVRRVGLVFLVKMMVLPVLVQLCGPRFEMVGIHGMHLC